MIYRMIQTYRHITYTSMTRERLQALARDRVPHLQSIVLWPADHAPVAQHRHRPHPLSSHIFIWANTHMITMHLIHIYTHEYTRILLYTTTYTRLLFHILIHNTRPGQTLAHHFTYHFSQLHFRTSDTLTTYCWSDQIQLIHHTSQVIRIIALGIQTCLPVSQYRIIISCSSTMIIFACCYPAACTVTHPIDDSG